MTSRLMAATPHQILAFTGRGTGRDHYDRLKAALDRLQSTTVATSIRQPNQRRRHRFSWINEWQERTDGEGRPLGIELIVPDWFYNGVLDQALVLTIDASYFDLTGGLERWLYRIVRKHGGRQRGGWSFDVAHLHLKAALAGGAIDILINNAGAYENLSWWEATPDKWLETIQSDALSSVRMIQRLVPAMRTRRWGRMIQVGSGTGSQPFAGYPQYCATKAMTHNRAVSLARELKNSGVTSNIVSPGLIKVKSVEDWFTRMAPDQGWGDDWPAIEAGVVRDILPNDIGRLGTPEEVAAAVVFLASPLAAYVSGANWRVDGGAMLNVN